MPVNTTSAQDSIIDNLPQGIDDRFVELREIIDELDEKLTEATERIKELEQELEEKGF